MKSKSAHVKSFERRMILTTMHPCRPHCSQDLCTMSKNFCDMVRGYSVPLVHNAVSDLGAARATTDR